MSAFQAFRTFRVSPGGEGGGSGHPGRAPGGKMITGCNEEGGPSWPRSFYDLICSHEDFRDDGG